MKKIQILIVLFSLVCGGPILAQDAKGGCSSTSAQWVKEKCYDFEGNEEVPAAAHKRARVDGTFRPGGKARQWFVVCTQLQTMDYDEYRLSSTDTLWMMIGEAEAGRRDWTILATFAKKFLVEDRGGRYGARCSW